MKKPIIGLAPLADYTDQPFGLICKKFGAQVIFREMLSAEAIVHQNQKTIKQLKISRAERPIIQQIVGHRPEIMAKAARIIREIAKPDGIDINMGCPVNKIIKNLDGVALMKEPLLAAEIVRAVKNAVKVPVSVKTRLGWSRPDEILSFAPLLEKAGADLLTIHGRTKKQGYEGKADWEMIGRVVPRMKIPVLANGGIFNSGDIKECLEQTRADGVLIARGALGNPWIFQSGAKQSYVIASEAKQSPSPSLDERIAVVLEHAKLQVEHYGDYGIILFRKHLLYYFKGLPGSRELKVKLTRVSNLRELEEIFRLRHSDPERSEGEVSFFANTRDPSLRSG